MAATCLVVGLGNPGLRYRHTRHNLGFMVVDRLADELKQSFQRNGRAYEWLATHVDESELIVAKPLTFMNRSGEAVAALVERFDVPLGNLLVVVDDFNLPFGKIRLRAKGSDGGHNGLASVIAALGSTAFPRLRIGIDDGKFSDAVAFVLSEFDTSEKQALPEVLDRATAACLSFVTEGIERTMSRFNQN